MNISRSRKHFITNLLCVVSALLILSACSQQGSGTNIGPISVATLASSPTPGPDTITETFDGTEEELALLTQQEASQAPFLYTESRGTYSFLCVLESISFLDEKSFMSVGDFGITVLGDCSFLDTNGHKQSVTVALVIQNSVSKTTWIPHHASINARLIGAQIQEFFNYTAGGIQPGAVTSVSFGMPRAENRDLSGGAHNAFVAGEMYSDGSDAAFAQTGDPAVLNGPLIPLDIARHPLTQLYP